MRWWVQLISASIAVVFRFHDRTDKNLSFAIDYERKNLHVLQMDFEDVRLVVL
jgi:hypothetical protein